MDITIAEIEKLANEYFNNLNGEKFKRDCKKAKINFYNKTKVNIFSSEKIESINCDFAKYSATASIPIDIIASHFNVINSISEIGYENIAYSDDYVYSIAA